MINAIIIYFSVTNNIFDGRGRSNAALGLWQRACTSKTDLNKESYKAPDKSMTNLESDSCEPLIITTKHLVIPTSHEANGRRLLNALLHESRTNEIGWNRYRPTFKTKGLAMNDPTEELTKLLDEDMFLAFVEHYDDCRLSIPKVKSSGNRIQSAMMQMENWCGMSGTRQFVFRWHETNKSSSIVVMVIQWQLSRKSW